MTALVNFYCTRKLSLTQFLITVCKWFPFGFCVYLFNVFLSFNHAQIVMRLWFHATHSCPWILFMCNKHSNLKPKLDEQKKNKQKKLNKKRKKEEKKIQRTKQFIDRANIKRQKIYTHKSRECKTTDEINDDDIPNSVTIQTQIASLIHLLFALFVRLFVPPYVRHITFILNCYF